MSDATTRWARITDLFDRAIALEQPTRREFVEREEPDASIRAEVLSLLESARQEQFLASPLSIDAEIAASDPLEGREIGDFRVLRRLGAGGMGVVYEARQTTPNRLVALKLIRPDLVTARGLERFRREIELLGRLQHPGIAAIHDAGVAPADLDPLGRLQPWCAMELVRGERLMEWADAKGLERGARLELLARICDAVDHANRRGVVHRDLKPANILVTEDGQPKVLDFGIARAMDAVPSSTLATLDGDIVGTLGSMSPEQLAGRGEIDARSDVYALGALAYELLVGRPAFDLRDRALTEAIRHLESTEPTRLGRLRRDLAGDIEVVVGKAMDRDPARRYATAAHFASDLRACADLRPVAARAPGALYLAGRFARRNRVPVTIASVAAIGLIAATVWAMLAWRTASAEAQRVSRVNHYLLGLLHWFDPARVGGPNFSLRQALDQASEQLAAAVGMDADLASEIHSTLGERYFSFGALDQAERHHRAALALRATTMGDASAQAADSRVALAKTLRSQGRTDEAVALYREAIPTRERLFGAEDARVAECFNGIGAALSNAARYGDAVEPLQRAAEILRRNTEPDRIQLSTVLGNLGVTLMGLGRVDDALPLIDEAVSMRQFVAGDDIQIALLLDSASAVLLHMGGRQDAAESMLRQVVQIRRRLLPADHLELERARQNLALLLGRQGKHREQAALLQESLEALRAAGRLAPEQDAARSKRIADLLSKADGTEPESGHP